MMSIKAGLQILFLSILAPLTVKADTGTDLFYALRKKALLVKDYTADVNMQIDVSYMKIPKLKGTMYFKSPDKLRLERHGGISLLPKKNVNLTISNLMPAGNVLVIDIGNVEKDGKKLHVLKVVPDDDQNNIVLAKLWVDEANLVAVRAETTTRNDGTIIMDLTFGKYINWGLPDKVALLVDLKDYKLPKGFTLDYETNPGAKPDAQAEKAAKASKGQKGTIKINYLKYDVNTGLSDEKFK